MSFWRHTNNKVVVVFDIGSGSVGGSLVIIESDKTPTILYTTRIPMVFKNTPHLEHLAVEMLKALQKSAEKIAIYAAAHLMKEAGGKSMQEVHCVFSSIWYKAKTHTTVSKEEKSFLITKRFIDRLLADAEEKFRHEIQSTDKEMTKNLTSLESKVIQTTLNGYQTSHPYGKRVRRIELALYISLLSSTIEKHVFNVVDEMLGVEKKFSHTFLLTFFSGVRDIFHTETDFLLADMGGEITNLGLVRNNILTSHVSFSWGRNVLLRKVATQLGTIPEEAHSLIRMWGSDELAKKGASDKVTKALATIEEEWLKDLGIACNKLAKGEGLPNHIFLVSLPDAEKWFTRVLESDTCSSYTFTHEPFQVDTLAGKSLSNHFSLRKGAAYDAYLGFESIFINRVVGL